MNIEDNILQFISKLRDKNFKKIIIDNKKFSYYTNETIILDNDIKSTKAGLIHDYLENSNYDEEISFLLKKKGNWNRIFDPLQVSKIDFSVTKADMNIKSFESTMKPNDFETLSKEEKDDIVNDYINKMVQIRNKPIVKDSTAFNREIQYKSRINNRVSKLTRLMGNKYSFLQTIKEYSKTTINDIPPFFVFDIKKEENYLEDVKEFLDNSKSGHFILRPLSGTQSR